MNRTTSYKEGSVTHQWYVVDATGLPLGRLAGQVAQVLRGKHKPNFAYNADCGDFVVVINADKVILTGNKKDELIYWHTGWPDARRKAGRARRKGDLGHAPEDPTWQADREEAQSLCRRGSPPRRPTTGSP